MFTLVPNDSKTPDVDGLQTLFEEIVLNLASLQRKKKICHEGKAVADREKLFKILTRAHKQCQHGGRDKTSAQVRRFTLGTAPQTSAIWFQPQSALKSHVSFSRFATDIIEAKMCRW
jgi:hypothetical protein